MQERLCARIAEKTSGTPPSCLIDGLQDCPREPPRMAGEGGWGVVCGDPRFLPGPPVGAPTDHGATRPRPTRAATRPRRDPPGSRTHDHKIVWNN